VLVLLAFESPGNDEETSELPRLQEETELVTLIAEFGLPPSTGRDGHSSCQFGAS
jgi:hypothetical protein